MFSNTSLKEWFLGGEKKKKTPQISKPFLPLSNKEGKKKNEKEMFQVKAGNCSRALPR